MYKVGTLNKISPVGLEKLTDQYMVVPEVEEADCILVRSQDMYDFDFSENLLAIARAGVGVNNIPLEKCADQGIVVFNTPGANANAVKELVLAAMLANARNIVPAVSWANSLEDGETSIAKQVEKGKSQFKGGEILGKTFGIVGLGGIGTMIATAAASLGMNVIGYDPFMTEEKKDTLKSFMTVAASMEEILPKADYFIVQVHATPETNGMINRDVIAKMKDGVVLMNFSRATIYDNAAVREALESGKASRYITDFPETEVMDMPNVLMTPHLGASTDDAEDNCAIMAVRQSMDYLENGNLKNAVSFPNVDLGPKAGTRVAVLSKADEVILSDVGNAIPAIRKIATETKGDYAYTLVETAADIDELSIDNKNILRIRIIK